MSVSILRATHRYAREVVLATAAACIAAIACLAALWGNHVIFPRAPSEGASMVAVPFIFFGVAFCAYFAGHATTAIRQARRQQALSRSIGWPAVGIAWLPSAYFSLLLAYLLIITPSFHLPYLE